MVHYDCKASRTRLHYTLSFERNPQAWASLVPLSWVRQGPARCADICLWLASCAEGGPLDNILLCLNSASETQQAIVLLHQPRPCGRRIHLWTWPRYQGPNLAGRCHGRDGLGSQWRLGLLFRVRQKNTCYFSRLRTLLSSLDSSWRT